MGAADRKTGRSELRRQPDPGLDAIGFSSVHVHDAFNIFMSTGIDARQKPFFLPPSARKGGHVEMVAEIDAVIAVSACPGGCNGASNKDLRVTIFDPGLTAAQPFPTPRSFSGDWSGSPRRSLIRRRSSQK
jgi:uncharacterized protein YcgI (DUF1989 family)